MLYFLNSLGKVIAQQWGNGTREWGLHATRWAGGAGVEPTDGLELGWEAWTGGSGHQTLSGGKGLEGFTYRACLSLGESCFLLTETVAPPLGAAVYRHRDTHRHIQVGGHTHVDTHTQDIHRCTDTCTHRHTHPELHRPIHRITCCSVTKSCTTLWPHGLQPTRLLCSPLSPITGSNSCLSSWWCYLTISSSATPFSRHPQSFLASESFSMSQLFTVGGQSIGASGLASVLPMNTQGWFPLGLAGLISLQSKGLLRVFSSSTIRKHQFFGVQPSLWSNSHIHTWLLEKP